MTTDTRTGRTRFSKAGRVSPLKVAIMIEPIREHVHVVDPVLLDESTRSDLQEGDNNLHLRRLQVQSENANLKAETIRLAGQMNDFLWRTNPDRMKS